MTFQHHAMDKFIKRTTNPNWRPIVRTKAKPEKKQTTITSLSKVVKLPTVQKWADDLAHLYQLFDNGTSITSITPPGPGTVRQLSIAAKRAKWKDDHDELEMSDFEDQDDTNNQITSVSLNSKSSNSTATSSASSSSSTSTPTTNDSRLDHQITSILQELNGQHMALETLESTHIGKVVKRLTRPTKKSKQIFPELIVQAANALVGKWRATAEEGLDRRKRRKASGVDDVVMPRSKKGKLDFHFRGHGNGRVGGSSRKFRAR